MVMLCLNETLGRLVMTYSVRWYCHVLRMQDGCVEKEVRL